MIRLLRLHRAAHRRGQALLEMAMILPIFLLLVLGTLEFGIAFDHNLTLEYATREGARAGSALANLGGVAPCGTIDNNIVAAVERVLTSDGSPIKLANVSELRIYWVKNTLPVNTTGAESPPFVNRWIPGLTAATPNSPALKFTKDFAMQGWPSCTRNNGVNPDSIGVSIRYNYNLQTALGALLSVVNFQMRDHTVMALNPTGK